MPKIEPEKPLVIHEGLAPKARSAWQEAAPEPFTEEEMHVRHVHEKVAAHSVFMRGKGMLVVALIVILVSVLVGFWTLRMRQGERSDSFMPLPSSQTR